MTESCFVHRKMGMSLNGDKLVGQCFFVVCSKL